MNRALIEDDTPPPLLKASPTLLLGLWKGGDKDPFAVSVILHHCRSSTVIKRRMWSWCKRTAIDIIKPPWLQFKIFLLNVFSVEVAENIHKCHEHQDKLTKKKKKERKEIEQYRNRYIRVRLGDKLKKKQKKGCVLHSGLCITKKEISVMKRSLQRGKRKPGYIGFGLSWFRKRERERERERERVRESERERERGEKLILLFCNDILRIVKSEEIWLLKHMRTPNLFLQHKTTYHWCSGLRSFLHEFLSSEGNNCKNMSNPATVPYAATKVLWYDTNHHLLQKQKKRTPGLSYNMHRIRENCYSISKRKETSNKIIKLLNSCCHATAYDRHNEKDIKMICKQLTIFQFHDRFFTFCKVNS